VSMDPIKATPQQISDPSLRQASTQAKAAAGAARRAAPLPPDVATPAPAQDSVELSDAARALAETAGPGAPAGASLTPERLRTVLDRVTQGFYDRPEIRDAIARQVAPDLEG